MIDSIESHPDVPIETNATTRYERRDTNVGAIALIGGVLAIVLVAVCLVSWWIFSVLQPRDRRAKISPFPLAVQQRGQLPPEPRLEQIERMQSKNPQEVAGPMYAKEQRQLQSYGWVDEKAGVVRLPIERAMQVIVEQKRLPARPAERR